jgi:hypothetical protein
MRARAVAKQKRMIAIAGRAEGAAGYACRFLSFEQLARKVCGTQPGGLDAREGAILIAAGVSEAMDLAYVKKNRGCRSAGWWARPGGRTVAVQKPQSHCSGGL